MGTAPADWKEKLVSETFKHLLKAGYKKVEQNTMEPFHPIANPYINPYALPAEGPGIPTEDSVKFKGLGVEINQAFGHTIKIELKPKADTNISLDDPSLQANEIGIKIEIAR